ncbi:MAG: hypothetical protein AB4206_07820 [Xenococcaceae cyanobacterium]
MIISELNHLEVIEQETSVVGASGKSYGGSSHVEVKIDKYVDVYVDEYVDVYKDFYVDSDVKGVSAFAEAEALAYGYDAHAEALTFTYTEDYFATASAQSISLTDY